MTPHDTAPQPTDDMALRLGFGWRDLTPVARGRVQLQVRRRGLLILEEDEPNIVVTLAKETMARLIGGSVVNRSITKIGFGTGSGAAAIGNTGLTGAYVRALTGVTYPAANQVTFAFALDAGEANGTDIWEFGLLTAGDVLFARRVRAGALRKDAEISLTGAWTIEF